MDLDQEGSKHVKFAMNVLFVGLIQVPHHLGSNASKTHKMDRDGDFPAKSTKN